MLDRVTIWNWREGRKLSGNSAPFRRNLANYFKKHPDWEEYVGQDKAPDGKKRKRPDSPSGEPESVPVRTVKPKVPEPAMRGSGYDAAPARRATPLFDDHTYAQQQARAVAEANRKKSDAMARRKADEEIEASRWREFAAIQYIIDHYNTGPTKSPFVGNNSYMNHMMNA